MKSQLDTTVVSTEENQRPIHLFLAHLVGKDVERHRHQAA